MSVTQVCFAAHAQRLVCPPPPASANGSVPSLAAPAEPGVGVDTRVLGAQQKRVALVVRMSPELREWFQQQALSNCRSLNGEIVFRLEAVRCAAVDGVVS